MAARAPWGNDSYPPSPQSPLQNPYEPRPRSYSQQTVPGFYIPSLSSVHPYGPPSHAYRQSPPPPVPPIPSALQPGALYRVQSNTTLRRNSNDLFFESPPPPVPPAPAFPFPQQHPRAPPLHHSQSSPPPPFPEYQQGRPHVPPKPHHTAPPGSIPHVHPHALHAGPSSYHQSISDAKPPSFTPPGEEEEDIELKRILEISAQESEARKREEAAREQAELAQALKASLHVHDRHFPSHFQVGPSPDFPLPEVSSPLDGSTVTSAAASSNVSPAFAHTTLPTSVHSPNSHEQHPIGPTAHSHVRDARQIAADEAFARKLVEEENSQTQPNPPQQQPQPHKSAPEALPGYEDVVSSQPSSQTPSSSGAGTISNHSSVSASASSTRPQITVNSPEKTAPKDPSHEPSSSLPMARSSSAIALNSTPLVNPEVRSMRSQSFTPGTRPQMPDPRPLSQLTPIAEQNRRPTLVSQHSDSAVSSSTGAYIDPELLKGVSLGFNAPTLSAVLTPLQDQIPNVIALPYGKCPAFHMKAPSWRSLLKLMARMTTTRLEPTIEAMAHVRTEMKLRTVVNFVKVHQSSAEWHVVLYMTIDHPVPATAPGAWKFRSGDTSTLPWSYTLSPLPVFLRDGADAPMSKWYNIPSTPQTPLPTLPISFPNLATYLISALEDSRNAGHDTSIGTRRLAKLIDACYPSLQQNEDGEEESHRSFFDRLRKKNRHSRDRNADTFDVVTPFVPEWG
ncbi:hypothetical protein ABKN59_000565 [Abortiporus biennis]